MLAIGAIQALGGENQLYVSKRLAILDGHEMGMMRVLWSEIAADVIWAGSEFVWAPGCPLGWRDVRSFAAGPPSYFSKSE